MTAVAIGLSLMACLAFARWVWPTPYRELRVRATGRILAAREHRLTGAVDVLTLTGWHRLGPRPAQPTLAPGSTPPSTADTADPLDGYRIDWRGYVPAPDSVLRLKVAR